MTAESAKLSALQVQQQLGTQALSIANQAPQMMLKLFARLRSPAGPARSRPQRPAQKKPGDYDQRDEEEGPSHARS